MTTRSFLVALKLLIKRCLRSGVVTPDGSVNFVIFTKDRPMQFDALLRSIEKHVKGAFQIHVLWRASTENMKDDYRSLLEKYAILVHRNIEEKKFQQDVTALLNTCDGDGVLFLVDDLLFVQDFDLQSFSNLNLWKVIPSLRLGRAVIHSQPSGVDSPPPKFSQQQPWLSFSWTEALGDWAMPLSLDGHLFNLEEISCLCDQLSFSAPNSLEKALGEYRFWFKFRTGLCYEKPKILNFAFNRVQEENTDFPCGEMNATLMQAKWRQGFQLNIEALSETPSRACHVVREPIYEKRISFGSI
jgi:hypothetical protein